MPETTPPAGLAEFARLAASGGQRTEIFEQFLKLATDAGVSPEAIDTLTQHGVSILSKSALPRSIKAQAGSLEASQAAEELFGMARVATKGIPDQALSQAWGAELRKRGIATASAKEVTGDVLKKAIYGTATEMAPEGAAKAAAGLATKGVAKFAGKAATTAGKVAGRASKVLTSGVVGLALGTIMPFGSASPLSLLGREGKARNKAVAGFAAMGQTSSAAVMNAIVKQQELASRRQLVLQKFEPEIFEQMLQALASNETNPSTRTPTERSIGGAYEETMPARRPDKDTKFLLDQLMQEMSGQL